MNKEEIDQKLRNLHVAFVGYKHRIMSDTKMPMKEKEALIEEQRLIIEAKKKELNTLFEEERQRQKEKKKIENEIEEERQRLENEQK